MQKHELNAQSSDLETVILPRFVIIIRWMW